MSRIFISYRRDDTAGYAGRIYDRLSAAFTAQDIFMDIGAIEPGEDFVEVIENAVGSCEVLLALIGKQWTSLADESGIRRLDDPHDFVRLEIKSALDRNIRVIPVLVRDASMPKTNELPDDLAALARRNAVIISDHNFHGDVDRLIEAIQRILGTEKNNVLPMREQSNSARGDKFNIPISTRTILLLLGKTESILHHTLSTPESVLSDFDSPNTGDEKYKTTWHEYYSRGLSFIVKLGTVVNVAFKSNYDETLLYQTYEAEILPGVKVGSSREEIENILHTPSETRTILNYQICSYPDIIPERTFEVTYTENDVALDISIGLKH